MSEGKAPYPVYDHDQHGHAGPDVEQGRVFFDEDAQRVVCSEHGDKCATDGTDSRPVTEAQISKGPDGTPFIDQANTKTVGTARLYKCTVCGQGTWAIEA